MFDGISKLINSNLFLILISFIPLSNNSHIHLLIESGIVFAEYCS